MPRKIYWKVLTKERQSAWLGYCDSKYKLIYMQGQRVEAHKGSLGCFVFESEAAACDWLCSVMNRKGINPWMIVPCHGHGRGKRPKVMIVSSPAAIDSYFYSALNSKGFDLLDKPPAGTICFPAITCLE